MFLDLLEKLKLLKIILFWTVAQKVTLVVDDAARPEPNHGSIATGQSHTINSEQIADLIPLSINRKIIHDGIPGSK